ncbi:amidohydrolase family protein [Candidatus Microgenomates bacterium]|nr:amidohydrolase family protein [Candidatus Microgenomates bacterium]
MIQLPGLIDPHVHLRDPGQTDKEDFYTGTSAALAGGYTTVVDMPNNVEPVMTEVVLAKKKLIAQEKTACDIGFYFGSLGDNLEEFPKIRQSVLGLKLYLNFTTGGFIIDEPALQRIFSAWNEVTSGSKPILLHAEEDVMEAVIKAIGNTRQPTHICHVSSKDELSQIIKAKEDGLPITCGVCPHHLFLTEADVPRLGGFGLMKPSLKAKNDQEYLWNNMRYVDVIESDHAPHTYEEKQYAAPPFGVPGLETTLPLMLTAVEDKRITLDEVIAKCHDNPKKILHLADQKDTYIEVDPIEYEIRNELLFTKCKWSPFNGMKVRGKVVKTVIRGRTVFEHGVVKAGPGSGEVI